MMASRQLAAGGGREIIARERPIGRRFACTPLRNGAGVRVTVALVAAATAAIGVTAGRGATTLPPLCRVGDFSLAHGFDVSPATGQHPLTFRLTNHGSRACTLFGYPALEFRDARGTLPFVIRSGGDQMIAPRAPRPVVVRPRAAAFVAVNKYRCDLGDRRVARTVRLRFSRRSRHALAVSLPRASPFGYCGRGDPGSTVTTSPFVAKLAAAFRH